MARKKRILTSRELRRIRFQQIIFSLIALMVILVMVIGLFARY